ncbi:hypothetical protein QTV44_002538 [Vibrio vulnificus]|nr:hypothetical protein [Vibrio vulnificus]
MPAQRSLTIDHHRLLQQFLSMEDYPQIIERSYAVLTQLYQLGQLASSEAETAKLTERMHVMATSPVSDKFMSIPHPARSFDMGMPMSVHAVYGEFFPSIVKSCFYDAISPASIDMLAVLIKESPDLRSAYPRFSRLLDTVGTGSLFTLLYPFQHMITKAPTFTFTQETCREVATMDISRSIDTSFMHPPASLVYFHLEDSLGLTVHDAATGYHELDGFYISESDHTQHPYDFDEATLDALGLDSSLPYRMVSCVFVGKPKEVMANDTLTKIDCFLQDGLSIEEMIRRTVLWYEGNVDVVTTTPYLGEMKNFSLHPDDNKEIQVVHNVRLLQVAINFMAYLNFAQFRRSEIKARSVIESSITKKAAKNQKKAAKKLNGLSDQIIIRTTSTLFGGRGSAESGYKVSPHVRRAFLRNQRYGSGDDVHYKPKFIAATTVAQGDKDAPVSKQYTVKK